MILLPAYFFRKMAGKTGIMVIGASGQIGTELVMELRARYGSQNVLASDLKNASDEVKESGPFELLDVMDRDRLHQLIVQYNIGEVYLLAALLSATAEQKVMPAWNLNMYGLFYVLELAKEGFIDKVYWPSSIAVFGPTTPKLNTPQSTIMEPTTVYGISKLAGERWCEYYHNRYGVDVRSLRYPGLIGYKSNPGGGTTDYAVDIFHKAVSGQPFECFLSENTRLPMMYMPDAIKATIGIMEAPSESVKIRSSYNISGFDFTPAELAKEIQKHIPDFNISYQSDFRQAIADGWPSSIDDTPARIDWGWKTDYSLEMMTEDMLHHLAEHIG
jgi:nucleoside-diphosphate-sugar epimerase